MKNRMIAVLVGLVLGVPMSCVKETFTPDASVAVEADAGVDECLDDGGTP